MYRLIVFVLFSVFSGTALTDAGVLSCGVYTMYGKLADKGKGEFEYVVNEGTLSEYRFSLTAAQEVKLAPYLNKKTKIKATIKKNTTDFHTSLDSISSVVEVAPDPAGLSAEKGLTLAKKTKCR